MCIATAAAGEIVGKEVEERTEGYHWNVGATWFFICINLRAMEEPAWSVNGSLFSKQRATWLVGMALGTGHVALLFNKTTSHLRTTLALH